MCFDGYADRPSRKLRPLPLLSPSRRPRRSGEWSPPRAVTFIVTLAATGSVTLAARAAAISRKSAYALKARDPAFAAAWAEAAKASARASVQGDKVHEVHEPPYSTGQGDRRSARVSSERAFAGLLTQLRNSAALAPAPRPNRRGHDDIRTIFFCGIGGSGMLPLASIVRASGGKVAGSDRSLDAGRTQAKFDYLRSLGIQLHAQDGSGLKPGMTLVTSAAVEETIPDVVRARELGLDHRTRPQFLAQLLNAAQRSVAVGGTSGKSTVTAMAGWILHACHRQPTVMNGAVMKNFVTPSAPFASALVGDPELFVSEVDESDGSIALYRPEVAVVNNITLDHKEMDELRGLFAGFLGAAKKAVVNLDDPEARLLAETVPAGKLTGYGFDSPGAAVIGRGYRDTDEGSSFTVEAYGERAEVRLSVPGHHNASNALAAIAASLGAGGAAGGCGRRARPVRGDQAPARDARQRRRSHGDRRFRAQPGQDRRQPGDVAGARRVDC